MRFYSLRFSLAPDVDFETRMKKLLDFCKKSDIDDVMFFIAPEDYFIGHITISQAKKWTDVILKAREILTGLGISISLNPWCTLCHWDGGRKFQDGQNFDTMVDSDGTKAEIVVCPLSIEWRKYYFELMSFYINTLKPKILWLEDDLRMTNHEPINNGCFCSKHMQLFNQVAGTNFDRNTFVKKIITDLNVRKAYFEVIENTLTDFLRELVNHIPHNCTLGLMTGGSGQREGRNYSDIFSIMTINNNKPYDRICLCSYRQRGEQEYCWAINSSSILSAFFAKDYANCVTEIENVPHSMYTKSANYLKYQMLTSIQAGFMGDTFSIFEFNGNGAINGDKYAGVLKEIKPYLSKASSLELKPYKMCGVKILVNKLSSLTMKKCNDLGDFYPYDSFLFAYFTQLGIACEYVDNIQINNCIVGVSGEVLANYTNDEIIKLFDNNFVIITGGNIDVLKERNLLYLVGISDYKVYKERSGVQCMEQINTGDVVCGVENLRAMVQYFCGDWYDIQYYEKVKEYTILINYLSEKVGSGIIKYKNILIIPFLDSDTEINIPISRICPLREYIIKQAIKENSIQKLWYFVSEENVCIYVYDRGNKVYIVCANFIDDNYTRLHISTPMKFKNINIITVENPMEMPANYETIDDGFIINEKLSHQTSYILVGEKY